QLLYVLGGFGAGGKSVSGEMWTYDIAADKWTSRKESGPRAFAAGRMAFIANQNRLFLFGGGDTHREVWYDPKADRWSNAAEDSPPPGRSYHSMCLDTAGGRIFVLGGTTKGFGGPNVAPEMWVKKLEGK